MARKKFAGEKAHVSLVVEGENGMWVVVIASFIEKEFVNVCEVHDDVMGLINSKTFNVAEAMYKQFTSENNIPANATVSDPA